MCSREPLAPAPHVVQEAVLALQTAGGNLERPYLDICLGTAHAPAAAPAYMWLEWHPYLEIPDFVTLRCVRNLERLECAVLSHNQAELQLAPPCQLALQPQMGPLSPL